MPGVVAGVILGGTIVGIDGNKLGIGKPSAVLGREAGFLLIDMGLFRRGVPVKSNAVLAAPGSSKSTIQDFTSSNCAGLV